jgi:hypothetical protein
LIWFCKAAMRACKQQPFLLLELDLDAHAVEDFQFRPHYHHDGQVDRTLK